MSARAFGAQAFHDLAQRARTGELTGPESLAVAKTAQLIERGAASANAPIQPPVTTPPRRITVDVDVMTTAIRDTAAQVLASRDVAVDDGQLDELAKNVSQAIVCEGTEPGADLGEGAQLRARIRDLETAVRAAEGDVLQSYVRAERLGKRIAQLERDLEQARHTPPPVLDDDYEPPGSELDDAGANPSRPT
jgi:hypothetical protein